MFAWNRLWRLRAWLDRCLGGTAKQLERSPVPEPLMRGKQIDFFHVEILDENRRIRLKTDMKLPGEAWLEFGIEREHNSSYLHHVVIYEPKGLLGLIYWYATYPAHALVFRGMHKAILRESMIGNADLLLNHIIPSHSS